MVLANICASRESSLVIRRRTLQPCLFVRSLQSIRRHQAIGATEDRIRGAEVLDPLARIIAPRATIGFQEKPRLRILHSPFDYPSRQVPGDVGCPGEEMIVPLASPLRFVQ